ncbi:MAG: hypothetical protein LDLANPLL_01923 [Turneriella sp.]|nr:hypothetical protein [Turneriella sp.]
MKKIFNYAISIALIFAGCSKPFDLDAEFGVVVEGPGVITTPSGLITTESGDIAIFQIQLRTKPTANVTLTLQSSNVAEGRLRALGGACDAVNGITVTTACTVVFTPDNWNQPQDIAVVGQDDLSTDGNALYTIFFPVAAASSDAKYNGLSPSAVLVTNTDNDLPAVAVTPTSGSTSEAAGNFQFSVVLQAQPSANVTISLTSSDENEGRIRRTTGVCDNAGTVATGACTLTFTAANWNITQVVTVTGVDELVADGNKAYTIVIAPAVSADTSYNGFDAPDVAMTSTDNDIAGFTLSATSGLVTTEAGGTASFNMRLNTLPSANVTIALTSSNISEGTVSPASLTFTTANWNSNQTVTVTGVADNRLDGNTGYSIVTAAATSSDIAYNGINPSDVLVTNTNIDSGKFLFVSNSTKNGSFGGSSAADAVCNADSAKPRAGTYKAVLGDASSAVVSDPGPPVVYDPTYERDLFTDWVLLGNTKYYRGADGNFVGTTTALGALPATLTNSVHNSSVQYWTGLSSGASVSDGCIVSTVYPSSLGPTWASSSSSRNGRVGDGTSTSSTAISASTSPCNLFKHFLCAEQ